MPENPVVLKVFVQAFQEAHENRVHLPADEIEGLFPTNLKVDLKPVTRVASPGHLVASVTEDQLRACLDDFVPPQPSPDEWWCHVMLTGTFREEPGVFGAAFNAIPSQDRFVRRGCALFLTEIDLKDGSGAKGLLKRTLAHELGHVLNLAHEDADGPSIMAARPEVEEMDLRWSEISDTHLRGHPSWRVVPGGGWGCEPDHRERPNDFSSRLISCGAG